MKLMTRKQLAEEFKVSYQWMSVIARRSGFPAPERKEATLMAVGGGDVLLGVVKRPAWLYDADKVKAFMDGQRDDRIPTKSVEADERTIPCGQCGELFKQRIGVEHWFCTRTCKEKAKRERNRLKSQRFGKMRNANK